MLCKRKLKPRDHATAADRYLAIPLFKRRGVEISVSLSKVELSYFESNVNNSIMHALFSLFIKLSCIWSGLCKCMINVRHSTKVISIDGTAEEKMRKLFGMKMR